MYKWSTSPGSDTPQAGWGGMAFSSFAGYRMGKLAGIHPRNTFSAVLIAMIVGPLFSFLSFLTFFHWIGGSRISVWREGAGVGERLANFPAWWTSLPASDPWIPYMILGMVWIAIASGAVTGCVIGMLIGGMIFIIRFFVPF
jgi:hypothetical protein